MTSRRPLLTRWPLRAALAGASAATAFAQAPSPAPTPAGAPPPVTAPSPPTTAAPPAKPAAAKPTAPSKPTAPAAPAAPTGPAFDVAGMDTAVKPWDDFFRYVNGGWIDRNPIPPEFTRWGSFTELAERNLADLRVLCEAAAKDPALKPNTNRQRIGDLYFVGMNEDAIEKAGAAPLQEELKRITAVTTPERLAAESGWLRSFGINTVFDFTAAQDAKDVTQQIAQIAQGGLGLPDRDYYLKDDDDSKKLREKYLAHIAKMFTLVGDAPDAAAESAKKVMALETELAKASMTRVELRDPVKTYNKLPLAEVVTMAGDFPLNAYLGAIGRPKPGTVVDVNQPEFLKAVGRLAKSVPMEDWRQYLRWKLVHFSAPYLSKAFVDEDFAMFGQALTGAKELKPRWKRVIAVIDREVGEALGQLYVEKHFPPAAKKAVLALVENLRASLGERIDALEWMSPATKAEAKKKLAAFTVKMGYPDKWRSYARLSIERKDSYLRMVRDCQRFEFNRTMDKIGRPVDRTEWLISPPTVNAYYNPPMNEIVFPAGILQPPFYSFGADDGINYGAIGMVIGHEMTHGFDDQGRQFDAVGNLRDWWTKEDAAEFEKRAKVIVDQFSSYDVIDGIHVNGQLTEGENIADLGGLKVAWGAFQKALAAKPAAQRDAKVDGFTPAQRFFLGYAQVWRSHDRPETTRLRLKTDPHAPPYLRVNAPLANLPEFAEAWSAPADAKMMRPSAERVSIW